MLVTGTKVGEKGDIKKIPAHRHVERSEVLNAGEAVTCCLSLSHTKDKP